MNNSTTTTPPNGYKKTAIGIIPIDWEAKDLISLVDILDNKRKPLSSEERKDLNGDIPYYGANGLVAYINDYIFDEKLILIAEDGGYFDEYQTRPIAYKIEGKSWVNNHAHVLKPKKNTCFDFIFYCLEHKNILKYLNGGTRAKLNKGELEKIKIQYTNIPEQQKISEILSTWDDAIATCKKTIDTLKDRNKGLAQQLNTGKKRLRGFDGKWEIKKIKDFSLEISLKNKEDEDLIVLSCTKHNGLVPSLEYFGRKIYSDNLKTYKIVEKNNFAYATNHIEEGSIGYQSKYDKALISPMYTVFKTDEDINDEFLFRVLKSNTYIQEYQKRMEGSIDRRGGLRWHEFSKIKVCVPSYEEQTAIALVLETADQELKSYETKLEALQLQKKGLMQQLLTGKIRVNL